MQKVSMKVNIYKKCLLIRKVNMHKKVNIYKKMRSRNRQERELMTEKVNKQKLEIATIMTFKQNRVLFKFSAIPVDILPFNARTSIGLFRFLRHLLKSGFMRLEP